MQQDFKTDVAEEHEDMIGLHEEIKRMEETEVGIMLQEVVKDMENMEITKEPVEMDGDREDVMVKILTRNIIISSAGCASNKDTTICCIAKIFLKTFRGEMLKVSLQISVRSA